MGTVNIPGGTSSFTTGALLDLVSECLTEIDKRGQDEFGSEGGITADGLNGIDTNWASLQRDEGGNWRAVYYCRETAATAFGVEIEPSQDEVNARAERRRQMDAFNHSARIVAAGSSAPVPEGHVKLMQMGLSDHVKPEEV